VIGSPEDLKAASVADVKEFFATWYDPANASLVLAGDFDPQKARSTIDAWLGAVPTRGKPQGSSAPPPNGAGPGAPPSTTLKGVVRETVSDNVELTKVTLAWQSPPHFGPGDAELDLLASVLSQGKGSRLYKTLVYDQKIAQEVSARQESHVLASDFVVDALVRPGIDPQRVEKALFDEIAKIRAQEVSNEELERARNGYEMEFVDRLQSVPERASLLNLYQAETGDPGYAARDLGRYRRATAKELLAYAKSVLLPDAVVVLTIVPKKEAKR
jgi:predicted Zn-dependent peptidase